MLCMETTVGALYGDYCRCSVWSLLHVTLLAPRILIARRLLEHSCTPRLQCSLFLSDIEINYNGPVNFS